MRIISLTLKNFQGIKALSLTPNGNDLAVYGDNGTGKTTVFNAFTWLLFGKASTGAKNFTPKTRGAEGELHGLEHTVDAVLECGGRHVSLTKTFREVYKKRRGSVHEEFEGHTTEFFVDGVPVKEKQYTESVEELWGGDADLAKILTMPEYFAEVLLWEKRRALLLELCGDVCDADVLRSDAELAPLSEALEGKSVDDLAKIMHAKKSAVNKRLSELPGRLDEAQRGAEYDGADIDTLQQDLSACEEEKRVLVETRALIAGTATAEKKQELAALKVELSEASAAYRSACIEQSAEAKEILDSLKEQARKAEKELSALNGEKVALDIKRDTVCRRRAEILKEYEDALALSFDEGSTVCPCCHRLLPEEEIAKLREDFNLSKSARLSEINEKGKREASRDMITALDMAAAQLERSIEEHKKTLTDATEAVLKAERALPTFPPFEETEKGREIAARIVAKREEIANSTQTCTEALAEQDRKIYAAGAKENALRDNIARYNAAQRAKRRVDALLEEQKMLAAEYEDAERIVYLCELFVRQKSAMLTERINEHFKTVRFSLFAEQINGGVKDECEALIPSADGAMVPYALANNAARINAGIEIIGTISRHLGIELPLFIDNAESVTHVADTSAQKILLVVSEKDKSLRAEVLC